MRLFYFAWVRTHIGIASEEIAAPKGVATIEALMDWLEARGPNYKKAFKDRRLVKAAINQEYVAFDAAIKDDDEIAFFPPVTGG